VKITNRQRAALVALREHGQLTGGSYVLAAVLGNSYIGRTLRSLRDHGLIESVRRTDVGEIEAYAYRITESGKEALK
jgi:DNA-binding PadR family transcriptional regulator